MTSQSVKDGISAGRVSPARRHAYEILGRVEQQGAYSSVLLARLTDTELSRPDRGLVQELVLGVLRSQGTLDYFIKQYSRREVARLDLPVRIALRLGLYQLRYLSRIPASAAVNESVNLVRMAHVRSAAGLVNGVLRTAARNLSDVPGGAAANPEEKGAAELSHPAWMVARWEHHLGQSSAHQLALANNQQGRVAFRVNTLRSTEQEALGSLSANGIVARSSELVPGAFVVDRGVGLAGAEAAQKGLIYLQDEASQLISLLAAVGADQTILDLCAAPGSKSSHLAALVSNRATIIAADIYPHRLATLVSTCNRLGARSVNPVALDGTVALPFVVSQRGALGGTREGAQFDRVLVDAPCSGTGTLAENPEIKWRLKPEDIARLAALQLRLLTNAATVVAPGGRLIYSTCSLEPEEGEAVIQEFRLCCPGFAVRRPDVAGPAVTEDGFVRTYPHLHGTAGFFAAVLERAE
jgi:16S rRNA (cytosine967-C5)-methyltransferase